MTNTEEGVGGCQTSEVGSFPRTKRKFFGGTKIHLFEFGIKDLNFGALCLSFGATYLNIAIIYLNFGAKIENRLFSKSVGGGAGGPPGGGPPTPRTSGRFSHRCLEKIFRPPLGNIF